MLIDTHCHIHEADYPLDPEAVMARAQDAGVSQFICVGTSEESSERALAFAAAHDQVYAAIGVHPHDTKDGWGEISKLSLTRVTRGGATPPESNSVSEGGVDRAAGPAGQKTEKLVAIGEIGLDYFYTHSPREVQTEALEVQIQLALDHDLPIIFHVREAFADFWPIFDNFTGIRGELHSFTDSDTNMQEALNRGLYIGVNGISTFTKDEAQQQMFSQIPLERMLLETDAPFLTPTPFRGKVNEPAFVRNIAAFHAEKRGISLDELGRQTSANARALFALSDKHPKNNADL